MKYRKAITANTMRVIPKVYGLDILDNNIFHNLYISEIYILYILTNSNESVADMT